MSRARRRRTAAGAATLSLALLASSLFAQPAVAATNWWYDTYDVAAVHAEGWTGDGVKIAVFDSQINPGLPVFEGRNLTVADGTLCADGGSPVTEEPTFSARHATTITAAIIGNGTGAGAISGIAPDADVTFYGMGAEQPDGKACKGAAEYGDELTWFGLGLQRAIDDGNRIVVTSTTSSVSYSDADVVANALAKGVVIVAATPNDGPESWIYSDRPWIYDGVVAATAVDDTGAVQIYDQTGGPLIFPDTTVVGAGVALPTVGSDQGWDQSEQASGSSFTAPLVGGMLAVVAQRYPEATGNQLLQTLINNTGVDDHPLEQDTTNGYGYGPAWLTHMLSVDPSQYPDENPLMNKALGEPTQEQVAAAAARGSALPDFDAVPSFEDDYGDTPATSEPIAEAPDEGSSAGLFIAAAVVGAIIVIGGIVLAIVVVSTRRKRIQQGGHS